MTILEALKYSVNYPLSDGNAESRLIARGFSDTEEDFTEEIANSRAYRLAYADMLSYVVTMVNLNQGGSVTQASVSALEGTANAIYEEYGEPLIGESGNSPKVVIMDTW